MDDDEYDFWDDTDEPCDHDDYDVDLLAGRAHCYRCGEAWWLTDQQLRREIELSTQMWVEAEQPEDCGSSNEVSEVPF